MALGLSMGFIPNWFPTFGFGPILSLGLAKITRVNVIAAVIGGIIGTPLWPVFFLFNYRMGGLFVKKPSEVNELEEVQYIEVVNDTVGSLQSGSLQFLIGALINVILSSLILYIVVYLIFKKYRTRILSKLKY